MTTITVFTEYICGPDTSIREVLSRIDSSQHLFQIVLDDSGRLLGTVTDGDVRRAMLKGVGLERSASECMQIQPRVGTIGRNIENRDILEGIGGARDFLPVLDDNGVVHEILISRTDAVLGDAIVMAGGTGLRLGEKTKSTPKPLLLVGDKPILEHVLTSLESAGVTRIFVAVHFLGEQIERFIGNRDNKAVIDLIWEPAPLGTAGALGLLGGKTPSEPAIVVNGDVITRADFGALHEFHMRHKFDGSLAVARYEVDIPFGVVSYGDDGVFSAIEEKPRISRFVAAGVYYLSPEFFSLVPHGRPMDMPELLNTGKTIGLQTGLFPIHEYWTDVGRPDDLAAANAQHAEFLEGSR